MATGSKSPFRKEKERISRRFQMNLEAIIAKYDHAFDGSDVLNLDDMTIVEDRGFLSSLNKLKIGKTILATETVSSHSNSGIQSNSTKDSTDSAFGSTRYSESEDTSGTETITNYSYQNTRYVSADEEHKADLKLQDVWMTNGSHSWDSGNEDADSDRSGPISTPSKSLLHLSPHHRRNINTMTDSVNLSSRLRARGNLSRRFDAEVGVAHQDDSIKRWMLNRAQSDEDDDEEGEEEEEEDGDPYEFREELPSILEEKNRFLCKMQSILIDSFIDSDEIDEIGSQSDDEVSTGTVESSEAPSGYISAWSTLPSKTTPKRTSKPRRIFQQDVDEVRNEIPTSVFQKEAHAQKLSERDVISSTDSEFTECSTILAGNLHNDQEVCHHSKRLRGANQKRDFISNGRSQFPCQAICNSTMLSEINTSEVGTLDKKSPLDVEHHRGLELPMDRKGDMYLGELPHCDLTDSKPRNVDGHMNKTPKADRNCAYSTPTRHRPPPKAQEVKRGDDNSLDDDLSISHTPSTRNHSVGDCLMSPGGHDASGITPRARLKKGASLRQIPNILSSPRFNTNEIMKIFRSPKPLIIPGMDLEGLELTPRRKVKREVATTPAGAFKNALLRLQSPASQCKADQNSAHHNAEEIRPQSNGSANETALECETHSPVAVRVKERNDVDSKRRALLEDKSNQFERKVGVMESEVCRDMRSSARLKEDRMRQSPSQPVYCESEIPPKSVQRVQTPLILATRPVSNHEANTRAQKTEKQLPNSRTCHNDHKKPDPEIRPNTACLQSLQPAALQEPNAKKHTGSVTSSKIQRASRSSKLSADSDSHQNVHPTSRKSSLQTKKAESEKPTQQSRHSGHTSDVDGSEGTTQNKYATPVASKTPSRTPTVIASPSTLSTPLNHMSLASPHHFYGEKDNLAESTTLDTQKKQRSSSVKCTMPNVTEKTLKLNSRKCALGGKARHDRTHMTIRLSDDSSEEEEMDVDPYSLTADDSSQIPRLYHSKQKLHPVRQSNTKCSSQQDGLHENIHSRDSGKIRTKTEHQSKHKIQDHSKGPTRDSKKALPKDKTDSELSNSNMKGQSSGSLRQTHNLKNSDKFVGLRQSDTIARNVQSPNRMNKHGSVGSNQRSPRHNPPPALIYGASATLLKHEQQKRSSKSVSSPVTRREHSQYFSDEEYNSSGDSAKFLSSVPNQTVHNSDYDSGWQPSKSPKLRGHAVHAVGSKHKTTIRCGQIISTPKDVKTMSPDLHKTRSPSRKGRVEKTRKLFSNSPTRTYQRVESHSESKSVRSSSKVNSGGQPIKMVARKLIGSPSSRHGDFTCRETRRLAMSSPLRSSGCNVSSSYTCEGPGHCTKPFCFNCALIQTPF